MLDTALCCIILYISFFYYFIYLTNMHAISSFYCISSIGRFCLLEIFGNIVKNVNRMCQYLLCVCAYMRARTCVGLFLCVGVVGWALQKIWNKISKKMYSSAVVSDDKYIQENFIGTSTDLPEYTHYRWHS